MTRDPLDGERARRDRRLFVVIVLCGLIGAVSLGVGVWGLLVPPPAWMPFQVAIAPVGEVVAGAIFLGFALFELVRRLRHGPQPPGRHTST